jgi:hypothetical protein
MTRFIAAVSNRLLVRNAVWNVIGLVLPMVVGRSLIPSLIDASGKNRFCPFATVWMAFGYVTLFRLGKRRAPPELSSHLRGGQLNQRCLIRLFTCLSFPPRMWTSLAILVKYRRQSRWLDFVSALKSFHYTQRECHPVTF